MPAGGPPCGKSTFLQHRVSMRFENQSVEDAFHEGRTEGMMLSGARVLVIAGFTVFFQSWETRKQALSSWEALPGIDKYSEASAMVLCALWLVVGGALHSSRLRKLVSLRAHEPMILVILSTFIFALLFCNQVAAGLLANVEPGSSAVLAFDDSDDKSMLLYLSDRALSFAIVNTVWHLVLPVRWSIATWFSALSWLTFAAYDASLRPTFALKHSVLVLSLVLGSSVGLRSLESKERALFAMLAIERRLRFEAEFRAEMQSTGPLDEDRGSSIQESSVPETTTTGALFNEAEGAGPDTLGWLVDLARREQWLIDEEDLNIADSKVLGRGGFGLVRTGSLHCTKVAIKMPEGNRSMLLQDRKTFDDESILAILNEVRVLRKARHPNIVLFFGACVGSADGRVWLVLEHIHGQMLATVLSRLNAKDPDSASAKDLLSMAAMICEALHYLHKQRPHIVHADVKPCNILVETRPGGPFPKLLDFGLSRLATSRNRHKGGTPQYMPPEVLREPGAKPSVKADVFAFGRLLFYMASERKPLAGTEPSGALPLLRSLRPPAVEWHPTTRLLEHCRPIIESCTLERPQERPSLDLVHRDLQRSLPLAAEPAIGRRSPAEAVPTWKVVERQCQLLRAPGFPRAGGGHLCGAALPSEASSSSGEQTNFGVPGSPGGGLTGANRVDRLSSL